MNGFVGSAALTLLLSPTFAAAQDLAKGFEAAQAGDYVTALREWIPLGKVGNVDAQFNLGLMYYRGEGVPQGPTEAIRWFRLAAEQGDAPSQYNLGAMYANGEGVPQEYIAAHMWFNIASANGHESAGEERNDVAKLISSRDVSEAQRRAKLCMGSNYSDCD